MYEYLFSTKLVTTALAMVLAFAAGLAVGDARLWWRGFLLNFTPMVAAAFYLVAVFAPGQADGFDLFSGFLLEAAVLYFFFRLLRSIVRALPAVDDAGAIRFLKFSLLFQLAVGIPPIFSEGFGIFSEGTRLDYLSDTPFAKYITYGGLLVTLLQSAYLACIISRRGSPGWTGGAVMLSNFALSILAGSKGGGFLWLASVLALIDYRRAKIPNRVILLTAGALCGAVALTANIVASFLGITVDQFFALVGSRFFLANDARALAFDLRTSLSPDAGVLAESFRSLATLFGKPPINPPLGVHLFAELRGLISGNGANSSLMALIIYYSPAGYSILPVLVALPVIALLYGAFDRVQRSMKSPSSRVAVLVFALFAVHEVSQDFLAFQVVMPMIVVVTALLWLLERNGSRSDRKRIRRAHTGRVVSAR